MLEKLERFRDDGFLEYKESKEHGKRKRICYTLTLRGLAWILNQEPTSMIEEGLKKFLES